MQIHLPPELEARIQELAAQANQTPEQLVASLVSEKLSYDDWLQASVAQGLASLDRGEYATQEEVEARFASPIQG